MSTLSQNIKRDISIDNRNIITWGIFAFNFIGGRKDWKHESGKNKIIIMD